jgi:hypothetical protein
VSNPISGHINIDRLSAIVYVKTSDGIGAFRLIVDGLEVSDLITEASGDALIKFAYGNTVR